MAGVDPTGASSTDEVVAIVEAARNLINGVTAPTLRRARRQRDTGVLVNKTLVWPDDLANLADALDKAGL